MRHHLANHLLAPAVVLVLVVALAGTAHAQTEVIDFETLPDGTPTTEDMLIHDAYAERGVTFELVGVAPDVGPRVARVGTPRTAFTGASYSAPECGVNGSTSADMCVDGEDVGCSFLTDDNIHNQDALTLRVNYLTPVFQASGELLDIDFTEFWTVEALDADDQALATTVIETGDPGTGNGIATPWSFSLQTPIHAIVLTPDTINPHQFGLAFDHFSPSSVPNFPICDAGGPYSGDAGVRIQFDGSGSSDPDGNESCCSPDAVVPARSVSWSEIRSLYR